MPARPTRPRKPTRPKPRTFKLLTGWPRLRQRALEDSGKTQRQVAEEVRVALGMASISKTLVYLLIRDGAGKTKPEMKQAFCNAVGQSMRQLGWHEDGEPMLYEGIEPGPPIQHYDVTAGRRSA